MAKDTNAIANHDEASAKVGKSVYYDNKRGCTKQWLLDNYSARLKTSYLNGYDSLQLVKYSDIVPVDKRNVSSVNFNIQMHSDLLMNSVMASYDATQIYITVVGQLNNTYTKSVTLNWNTYVMTSKPYKWNKTNNSRSYGVHSIALNFTIPSLSYWPDATPQHELVVTVYYHTSSDYYSSEYDSGDNEYVNGTILAQMDGKLTTLVTNVSGFQNTDDFSPYAPTSDGVVTNYKVYSDYGYIDASDTINYFPVLISRNK